MGWLRRFSIRSRLVACMALVVMIGLVIGAGTTLDLLRLQTGFQSLVDQDLKAVTEISDVAAGLGTLRRAEKDMLINAGDTVSVASFHKSWNEALAQTRASLGAARARWAHQADAHKRVQAADQHVQAYAAALKPVGEMLESGTLTNSGEASQMAEVVTARQEVEAAEQAVGALAQVARRAADARRAEVQAHIRRSVIVLWVLLLSPGVVFLPLMVATIMSVVGPLRQAEAAATAIAQGDLAHPIDARGDDEMARLLKTMSGMQASLREMVDAVRRSSADMLVASTEIAAGNQDLSARTEQAAANLQQTTSSMEQLDQTVRESADAARSANSLAQNASQRAEHGGQVVGEVVANMDQISEASRKIADIIGVIDNIAFQTNILALNAAVEAARAGEQGRGFAVVASEVRNLAQRSAQAAREIKTLIGTSVERVEVGSQRVRDAGAVMQEIVEAIQRVTQAMSGIAASSSSQSQGLSQVSEAISGLDRMTQQNAALVEQSAAAAESLKNQADTLARVVTRFRVESATG